jgi:hypothetical protein
MGRPTTFDREVFDQICGRMAEGETLRAICREEGMPGPSTVRSWAVLDIAPGVAAQYARARDAQMESWGDETVEIADTPVEAVKTTEKADGTVERVIGDAVERAKLRIDTRKWIMARIARKTFGDRPVVDDGGETDDARTIKIIGGLPE